MDDSFCNVPIIIAHVMNKSEAATVFGTGEIDSSVFGVANYAVVATLDMGSISVLTELP